ncbi:outer membrane protein assembly factor BamD [Gracilimonas sediminicola]|uniref:Outer membrane protein assembly factor BamD n=1 Tax=Gracilimonas sediminicola TaxID=2952158 RepID=A0A9X2RFM3_9BACT|nr:outer membrane protein assembly factor BamD [Gracilimonas sediminicola]MCP9292720.1 outer membrane protein assembly factor BamD [Gracilimonas sediminicola]
MRSKLLAVLAFLFIFSACKNDRLIKRGDSVEVAYQKAMAFYEEENYSEAANAFDTVTRVARGTEYGQDAQYYLAESYYKDKQFLLAASEYDRYISYYPQDERRPQIEFRAAMCYYELSPRYKLDQNQTRKAIERFRLFNNRYPDHEKVQEAAARIDELREKLAHKSYEAARFYVRTEQYKAATIYLDKTIDQYPESKWAERALVDQIQTYINYADNSVINRQAERYGKAIENYEKFLQLFPESKFREEVENYHDEAVRKLADVRSGGSSQSEVADSGQD